MNVKRGDLVVATSGRDENKLFMVIEVADSVAKIVDGKSRKVVSPKRKNVKHLKVIKSAVLIRLAEKIIGGERVGDSTVRKAITESQKNQEE